MKIYEFVHNLSPNPQALPPAIQLSSWPTSNMPTDSLVDMSLRACCKIHKQIKDIGELPYNLARPFLLKIDNPEQLRALEMKSQQIIGHDAEIWLALIKRDIPDWETRKHRPNDPKDWWKVYNKLKRESAMEMDAGADKLKAALNDKNEKRLAEIKPMKALAGSRGPSLQARVAYGYQSGKTGSRGTSKMGVLEKIKKEARDAKAARAIAEQQIRKRMATAVTRAPAQFIDDVRTQRQKEQQSPERVVRASQVPITNRWAEGPIAASPRTKSSPAHVVATSSLSRPAVSHRQVQEREARLRALTSRKPLPTNSTTSLPPLLSPLKISRKKETPIVSVEAPSTPKALPELLSASFLEEPSPPSTKKMLGDDLGKPSLGSGGIRRSASPQITSVVRKRKKEPDLFHAPAKRKVVAASGGAVVR